MTVCYVSAAQDGEKRSKPLLVSSVFNTSWTVFTPNLHYLKDKGFINLKKIYSLVLFIYVFLTLDSLILGAITKSFSSISMTSRCFYHTNELSAD